MRLLKPILTLILAAAAFSLYGQTAREQIAADPGRAGGVYYVYTCDNPERTPAPEGYEPCYISHYGRHGSRWLLRAAEYTKTLAVFDKAAEADALTEFGQDVHRRIRLACEDAEGRVGDLTPLGAEQHTGIARRMFESYPEVFGGEARIDARSTIVVRCVLSMAAFCGKLQQMNPELDITRTANLRTTRILNFFNTQATPDLDEEYLELTKSERWKKAEDAFRESRLHPQRLKSRLFSDADYASKVDGADLMQQLWAFAVNEQDTRTGIRFDDVLTQEELYAVWECVNYRYYHYRGPGKLNRGYAEHYATVLLEDLLTRADSALMRGEPAADLRFGHDGNLMPLVSLMRFEGCAERVDDPDRIADVWQDFRISPMAANVQMIFYRKKGSDEVLVKLLHNEREVRIPLDTDLAPYYRWSDLKKFYLERIADANVSKQ